MLAFAFYVYVFLLKIVRNHIQTGRCLIPEKRMIYMQILSIHFAVVIILWSRINNVRNEQNVADKNAVVSSPVVLFCCLNQATTEQLCMWVMSDDRRLWAPVCRIPAKVRDECCVGCAFPNQLPLQCDWQAFAETPLYIVATVNLFSATFYLRRGGYVFNRVCLFVCSQDYSKTMPIKS